jgi:hypothetical protein
MMKGAMMSLRVLKDTVELYITVILIFEQDVNQTKYLFVG